MTSISTDQGYSIVPKVTFMFVVFLLILLILLLTLVRISYCVLLPWLSDDEREVRSPLTEDSFRDTCAVQDR